jgi:quinol monooxygenase YgiN
MAVKLAILALVEARPDKGADLAAFLERARAIAVAEQGTVSWYAFKIDETHYGIFDTFESESARTAHMLGQIPAGLAAVSIELLAAAPDIRTVDIVAVK